MYKNGYKGLGRSIGLYDENKLIGFIYYEKNKTEPYWYKVTREKLSLPFHKIIWENKLIEIHPKYRGNGLACRLLSEVYGRMPSHSTFLTMSEYTDKHIMFYEKNGFIQSTKYKNPKYYLFYRLKE